MPIEKCQQDNKPGFRWNKGKCFCYNPESKRSTSLARQKAKDIGIKCGDYFREVMDRLRKLRTK